MKSRRQFVARIVPAALLGSLALRNSEAQGTRFEESDPVAKALHYHHDATQAGADKSPGYVAGRHCSQCQLYQAQADGAWGACAAVGGKLVAAGGWCSAWSKKA